ncbi:MAG: histidine--tRNA ligase [Candidatus Omnitrophica bacterium CG03_land_8_20_14_0_80_43_22]|nr:MAG: histidine--tRNA ligase [Candidatus Omnitrophica bacterium CG03_land_8_20_14_0_80_43_22]
MQIKTIRGTKDILPNEAAEWVVVETAARELFSRYGYAEIRTPVIEETALFSRSVGETSDIVQKQMYSFKDRGERSITLRPEGTAPVVRAYLENNINNKQGLTKLFYMGPMFRAERPQAGRQRQFHQIGVEAIGSASPYLDAEVIILLADLLKAAGVTDFQVNINNLGCAKDKESFAGLLKKALKPKLKSLCENCQERFDKNTLRVLDCKNPDCKKILPEIADYQCQGCKDHYKSVLECLKLSGVKFKPSANLVRGLDYYTGTVFEVISSKLGSQDALAAGGRYDNLIKDLGGPSIPAVGFAIGIERLLMASGQCSVDSVQWKKIYIATLGEAARKKGFELASQLRERGICCLMEYDEKSLKAQLKAASNQKCDYAAILGDDELKKGKIILRDMSKSEQSEISLECFVTHLKSIT